MGLEREQLTVFFGASEKVVEIQTFIYAIYECRILFFNEARVAVPPLNILRRLACCWQSKLFIEKNSFVGKQPWNKQDKQCSWGWIRSPGHKNPPTPPRMGLMRPSVPCPPHLQTSSQSESISVAICVQMCRSDHVSVFPLTLMEELPFKIGRASCRERV